MIRQADAWNVKRIFLGYAVCGNSVAELETGGCEVIFPRTDDCVAFFPGSMEKRRQAPSGTYFLAHGWLYGHGQAYYDKIMEQYSPGCRIGTETLTLP